jgi:hypothetical protein
VAFEPARTVEVEGRAVQEGAGCVGLVSSGESPDESMFLDASETGGDVFFLTTSRLSKADFDDNYDVYDAHVCGAEGVPCTTVAEPPTECTNEASCKPAPTPQPAIFGLPSSATFSGAGNIVPSSPAIVVKPKFTKCKMGFVKKKVNKKVACVKKSKSKKAKAKKAGRDRRATR